MVTRVVRIEAAGRWLRVELEEEHRFLSWAPVSGGFVRARQFAILYLTKGELASVGDPPRWLREQMRKEGMGRTVGMMTSRARGGYSMACAQSQGDRCDVVATLGLSNALAAGDPAAPSRECRTINMLCILSKPLTRPGLVEAVALAAEARAAAMIESGIVSRVSGRPATGTGTDCIAVACPNRPVEDTYCGKHTALGEAIGRAVREALSTGISEWRREQSA
jgi:adenosylcobinamide amidohydrolase